MPETAIPLTLFDLAVQLGAKENEDGSVSASEFDRLGLPFYSGCQVCSASLGPAQAFPSTTGFIRCRHCIGEQGFESLDEFESFYAGDAVELP